MPRDADVIPLGIHGFTPEDQVEQLASDDLARSGLTLDDAKALGITWINSREAMERGYPALPCLVIPYYDPAGNPLGHRKRPFQRVRFLRIPANRADHPKYMQLPGSGIHVYFPRIGCNWIVTLADPTVPLYVTEGEKKAAKACKEGFPCFALGGVNSYQSKQHGDVLIDDLRAIDWWNREVRVCFDSDLLTNINVREALMDFALALEQEGADVRVVLLGSGSGRKVGLDDFLVEHDAQHFRKLSDASEHIGLSRDLWKLNTNYAYVKNISAVVHKPSGLSYTPENFKMLEGRKDIFKSVVKKNGEIGYVKAKIGPIWLEWGMRNDVSRIVYQPGDPPFAELINKETGEVEYNCWPGWGCESNEGDITPFLELSHHLLGADPAVEHWTLSWFGYPIKHPGTKLHTSLVLLGGQGIGKSLLCGNTMRGIYGRNAGSVSQADLCSTFNKWAERKQYVIGDDITGVSKLESMDKMKNSITDPVITINTKFQQPYEIADVINNVWTTNRGNMLMLDKDDRRFCIVDCGERKLSAEFYRDYARWLADGGAAALRYYFENIHDYGDFNPHAAAHFTLAKRMMAETARPPIDAFCHDLADDPDTMIPPADGDLFSFQELRLRAAAHLGIEVRDIYKSLVPALQRARIPLVHDSRKVKGHGFETARYYVIRNHATWSKATLSQIQAHLRRHKLDPARRKF